MIHERWSRWSGNSRVKSRLGLYFAFFLVAVTCGRTRVGGTKRNDKGQPDQGNERDGENESSKEGGWRGRIRYRSITFLLRHHPPSRSCSLRPILSSLMAYLWVWRFSIHVYKIARRKNQRKAHELILFSTILLAGQCVMLIEIIN